ncbi:MAG TPA: undecaprenyl-phosphate glucose phosphotransferase, partial [Flavobacteriaceae bacterium]|nr:undecaprenyl-phosphate glucose phosphotransferase [Flavobacteriaceae bacterium]
MIYKTGRYSGFLRPISYAIDLAIIHVLAAPFFEQRFVFLNYILFVSFAWIAIALRSNFYEIYRFTRTTNILALGLKQGALFLLLVFAFFGFYREIVTSPWDILRYVIAVMALITLTKIAIYYLLKKYRILLKGNLRRVVIIGLNQKTDQLRKFFEEKPEYGYVLLKTFNLSGQDAYSLEQCLDYIDNNQIDEIYASVAQLDNPTMSQLIDYADNNLKILKFLPDNKDIYSKRLDFTYYGYLPI